MAQYSIGYAIMSPPDDVPVVTLICGFAEPRKVNVVFHMLPPNDVDDQCDKSDEKTGRARGCTCLSYELARYVKQIRIYELTEKFALLSVCGT